MNSKRRHIFWNRLLRRDWLILVALVLVTRIGFLLLFGHTLSLATSGYDVYAVNLLAGHGYTRFADLHPDSDLPPLYSFTLAAIYTVLGRNPIAVAVVQIGFEIGTVLFISRIGRMVGGRRVSFLAGLLTALYPYQLFQDMTVNDTAIFIFLLSAGMYFAARALYRAKAGKDHAIAWILSGIFLGVGALTKTLALLTIPVLILAIWHRSGWRHGFSPAIRAGLLVGGAAILVIAPWAIRNTLLNHAFSLVSTNDGSNFYQGNNPCAIPYMESGWDVQWSEMGGCLKPVPTGLSDLQADHWEMQQGLDFLKANVSLLPRLFADKFLVLWSPDVTPRSLPPNLPLASDDPVEQYNTPLFALARTIQLLYFGPLLILAVVGFGLALRYHRPIAPILAVLVAVTVTYLIFHPSTRYRAPADPFVSILSANALVVLLSLWRSHSFRLRRAPVA